MLLNTNYVECPIVKQLNHASLSFSFIYLFVLQFESVNIVVSYICSKMCIHDFLIKQHLAKHCENVMTIWVKSLSRVRTLGDARENKVEKVSPRINCPQLLLTTIITFMI